MDIHQRLKEIEDFLLEEYKESRGEKRRDWRTYEQRLAYRIKEAIRNLEPLIEEATATIKVHRGRGKKPELTLKQKILLFPRSWEIYKEVKEHEFLWAEQILKSEWTSVGCLRS